MLGVFLIAGLWHLIVRKKKAREGVDGADDYHLASRALPGWIGGLSAAASSHSAFMLTGMVGAILYKFAFVWLLIGWFFGAAVVWLKVYPHMWAASRSEGSVTLTQYVAKSIEGAGRKVAIYGLAIALTVLMGFYASAQIIAADATFKVVFGSASFVYVLIAYGIVLIYSALGGLRSTVNSDVLQGIVILISVASVLLALITRIDSGLDCAPPNVMSDLREFMVLEWGNGFLATALFIGGWFVGGAAEMGAPHVMPRVFAVQSLGELKIAAFTYLLWFAALSSLVILLALSVKVAIPCLETVDASTGSTVLYGSLIVELLPDWMVGVALAGFVAATISTADALILAAGASISEDIGAAGQDSGNRRRILTTGIVGIAAFASYLLAQRSVATAGIDLYSYITLAWALISCVFVPAVILRLVKRSCSVVGLLLSSFAGILTILAWTHYGLQNTICYELLPGLAVAIVVIWVFSSRAVRIDEGLSNEK